jgi:hypothetical protein
MVDMGDDREVADARLIGHEGRWTRRIVPSRLPLLLFLLLGNRPGFLVRS